MPPGVRHQIRHHARPAELAARGCKAAATSRAAGQRVGRRNSILILPMSDALAPIAEKLKRRIRLLSSDNDGEVIAAARALNRTLKGANLGITRSLTT
jgi:hypothetical protein